MNSDANNNLVTRNFPFSFTPLVAGSNGNMTYDSLAAHARGGTSTTTDITLSGSQHCDTVALEIRHP